jgi:hypothetical protein
VPGGNSVYLDNSVANCQILGYTGSYLKYTLCDGTHSVTVTLK